MTKFEKFKATLNNNPLTGWSVMFSMLMIPVWASAYFGGTFTAWFIALCTVYVVAIWILIEDREIKDPEIWRFSVKYVRLVAIVVFLNSVFWNWGASHPYALLLVLALLIVPVFFYTLIYIFITEVLDK